MFIPVGIVPIGMLTAKTSTRVEINFQIPMLAFRFRNAAMITDLFVTSWLLTTGQLATLGASFAFLVDWIPS